ncbi:MAG TPA: hypothetical protein VJ866_13945 [Pyrinomonadaceae bacterium]|nr:hypothetical protein [Pyrinomonadaceae bacterium]
MLRVKTPVFAFTGVGILALSAGLLVSTNVKSQHGRGVAQTAKVLRRGEQAAGAAASQPSEKEIDEASTPVVDFDSGAAAPDRDSPRGRKNARYNRAGFVVADPTNLGEVRMSSDPRVPPSDMPVDASDLVVEGRVLSAEAFLSDDKSAVYSEFTIRVSRGLKSAPELTTAAGDTVIAERLGGRVRYPSGKIVRYRVAGEGSPTKGGEYLFFLKRAAEGNYAIVTAYGMRGNTVFALDGARIMLRGETIFDRHNGKDRSAFIEEVNRAVLNSRHAEAEVRSHE